MRVPAVPMGQNGSARGPRSSSRDLILALCVAVLLFGVSILMISVATPKGHAASDLPVSLDSEIGGILDPLVTPGALRQIRQQRRRDSKARRVAGEDAWDVSSEMAAGAPAVVNVGEWDDSKGRKPVRDNSMLQERSHHLLVAKEAEIRKLRKELDDARAAVEAAKIETAAAVKARRDAAKAPAVVKEGAVAPPPACTPAVSAPKALPVAGGGVSTPLLARPRPKACMPNANGRTLLNAWRARQVDWHDLVKPAKPQTDDEAAGEYRYKSLVQSELDTISYLQGFLGFRGASGSTGSDSDPYDVSRWYAPSGDWGPMAKYGACPILRDKCMVHATDRECVLDELCGWCASRGLCVDRLIKNRPEPVTGSPVASCPHPLLVLKASVDAQLGTLTAAETGGLTVLSQAATQGPAPTEGQCDVIVTRNRPVRVEITGNAKMAYHFFTENAGGLHAEFHNAGATGDLAAHVWIPPHSIPEFHELMHGYTDSCYRYTYETPKPSDASAERSGTVCYTGKKLHSDGDAVQVALWDMATRQPVTVSSGWVSHESLGKYRPAAGAAGAAASTADSPGITSEADAVAAGHRLGLDGIRRYLEAEQATDDLGAVARHEKRGTMPDFLIAVMGLWDVRPSVPHVALLSRRNKRLILNEPELVAEVLKLGGSAGGTPVAVEIASLETMTLYEQIYLFRRTSVLAGIHGSGLINSIFMHQGTALIQLMPFKVASGASFFAGPASGNGVAYFEWTNPKLENTVHHFHFLGPDHAGDRQELVLCGSACGGPDVYFSFHINQDTWVDEADWRAVVLKALTESDVNKQLFKPPPGFAVAAAPDATGPGGG